MKKTITVGEHQVEVTILPSPNGAIAFTAKCGDVTRKGMINPTQAKHDHTEEQFRKDIADFATRLAEECAGHAQAVILSNRILGADENEKIPTAGNTPDFPKSSE